MHSLGDYPRFKFPYINMRRYEVADLVEHERIVEIERMGEIEKALRELKVES